jgi:hypothetical protein
LRQSDDWRDGVAPARTTKIPQVTQEDLNEILKRLTA